MKTRVDLSPLAHLSWGDQWIFTPKSSGSVKIEKMQVIFHVSLQLSTFFIFPDRHPGTINRHERWKISPPHSCGNKLRAAAPSQFFTASLSLLFNCASGAFQMRFFSAAGDLRMENSGRSLVAVINNGTPSSLPGLPRCLILFIVDEWVREMQLLFVCAPCRLLIISRLLGAERGASWDSSQRPMNNKSGATWRGGSAIYHREMPTNQTTFTFIRRSTADTDLNKISTDGKVVLPLCSCHHTSTSKFK